MRYSLRQLEVFLATARYENITKAARSVSLSQSAASDALSSLEQQFDLQLFDRVGKRLQLNSLGRDMKPKVAAFLESAKALEDDFIGQRQAGSLKVGATLSIGNYLAVRLVADYMCRYPESNVQLYVANTQEIARKVADFEIDIGLVEGAIRDEELSVWPWRDDELVVFAAPHHPYAKQCELDDQALLDAPWILRETGSGTRQAFDRALQGLLPSLRVVLELQHTEAIKRAVEAGLGVGCLSRITLEDAFKRGSLVPLMVPHRDFTRQFYFVLHKEKYRSSSIERWIELCAEMRGP